MSSKDEVVGRNVRAFREAAGMSQAELAKALSGKQIDGMHPQTITKVESGNRSLKLVEALALAEILGVQPTDLYEPPTATANDLEALRRLKDLDAYYRDLRQAYINYFDAAAMAEALDLDLLSRDVARHVRAALSTLTEYNALKSTLRGTPNEKEAEGLYGALVREMEAEREL